MDVGESPVLIAIKAFLCTGLSMLLVILAKLSTLTHRESQADLGSVQKAKRNSLLPYRLVVGR